MDGVEDTDNKDKNSFWKVNVKTVPGRPSQKNNVRSYSTSFEAFQKSVSDAWDIDDDEVCIVSNVKICKKLVRSTALKVINNHWYMTHSATEFPTPQSCVRVVSKEKIESTQEAPMVSSAPNISSSPRIVKHYPGHPQAIGVKQTMSKFHISNRETSKLEKFHCLLETMLLNLEELKQLSWSGVPVQIRAITWRLLSAYLPASRDRRAQVLCRKRLDYWNLVDQYYDTEWDETYKDTYRQIHIDIPRMSPLCTLFQQKTVQEMFERILFIWAIRHPASGYVQGINDLLTPFYIVFLQEIIPEDGDLDNWKISTLPKEHRDTIEADSFWCLSKFLDGIQDNYIFAQLGIQHKVNKLKELIQRIDGPLHQHLQNHGVDYLQFSFRWMNNLLTRDLPLHCTIRLWDTYLAESDNFASFQLYVCASFLLHWRRRLLLERDFQGLMLMLQNLPTENWCESDIGLLVAEAYRLKFTFSDTPNHLQSGVS